ncbi:hypothetical protein ACFQVD_26235 [Streptosporangium amethystogenes subsp. fukuiense]|uniref:Uncharacterized protein n=1 Tax=Streptosporangium amethystogenes subsp. fukuiense TaxID=698418 RepID=A0ABW2T6C8_9ACTN
MTADTEVTALDRLAAKFPDWRIWRSDRGHWYATRRTPVTEAQGRARCNRMVDASNSDALDELLTEQQERAARAGPL